MIAQELRRSRLATIWRASALVTFGVAISAVCSLVTLGLNARALGATQFGMLALIQAYVSFIGGLTTFDNSLPVVRLGIRSPKRLGLIIGAGITLDTLAAFVAASIAVSGMLLSIGIAGMSSEHTGAALVYSLSLLANIGGTAKGYFRLAGRFDVLVKNQITNSLLLVVCSALLWVGSAPFHAYLIVFGVLNAAPGLSIMLRMVLAMRREGTPIHFPLLSNSRRRYLKAFSRLAGGNSILSTIVTSRYQVALFIVAATLGATATGLFAAAVRCASALTRFVMPINHVIFPEILRYADTSTPIQLRNAMRRATFFVFTGAVVIAAGGTLVSKQVVVLVAGEAFASAADIFSLLLIVEVTLWAGLHFSPIIIQSVGQRPLLVLNATAGIITAVAAWWIAARTGSLGVAAVMVCGGIVNILGLYFMAEWAITRSSLKNQGVAIG